MKSLTALLLACALGGANAAAPGDELSTASALVAGGGALVVFGSLSAVAASGEAVVTSVEAVGGSTVVLLASASDTASAAVKIGARGARGASLAVGQTVSVVAMSTGHALVASGEVVAFVPNAIGGEPLRHSRVDSARR
ncbi:hypothetical protein [Massilia glaciei]|uniref:Uncharacterized protein n=1 Tax=Massilia glaciei TaxID=1524097 RepID=A0A2U2HFG6_9BURK|nr:hypothetical protein [Massilia glaciei]PWF43087.1 hypothetical protein C7C56_021785 [Massilia glaciei]